ncbi:MAG: hypothetical protein J5623_02160 [Clostridiales bacterium]|nr:hypothetical protein [Clostridiales bacterium]
MSAKKAKKKVEKAVSESVKDEEAKAVDSEVEETEAVSEDIEAEEQEDSEKKEAEEGEEGETEVSADAEASDEDSEEEEDEDEESEEKPVAKKDPIPAIMAVVIVAIIMAAVLYYVLPKVLVPSFGYTLEEFNTRLDESDISKKMQAQYTTLTPQFKAVDKESIKEIWSIKGEIDEAEQKRLDARFKPFVKTLVATEELENVLVEANTRKSDGQLTRMCVYCTYDDQHMTMMMVHFGAILGNFMPDLTFTNCVSLLMSSSNEANLEGLFYVRGDIAFKLAMENIGGKLYIKLEIVPAKSLKAEQIKSTFPVETTAASETTAATSAT